MPDLMDTEPGGETQQYESIKTATVGHGKETGQFGGPGTQEATSSTDVQAGANAETGDQDADMGVSEQGMGGQTTGGLGQASTEGGFGGTEQLEKAEDEDPEKSRKEQGYGSGIDMDRTIGA